METILPTRMPRELRARAMWEELVSTIWPMRISSPIVQTEALVIVYLMLFKYLIIRFVLPGP